MSNKKKRNKPPVNPDGWYLHPTKGWKRKFKLQRMVEAALEKNIVDRVKERLGWDLNKP